MTLARKALVQIVYPKAVCAHVDGEFRVWNQSTLTLLGSAPSARGAWSDAYDNFSKAQKRRVEMEAA